MDKKFIQQCSDRDSGSYETLCCSFLEKIHVAATSPNFYENRVLLLNIKEGTHDKSPGINQSIKPLDFFRKTALEHH